MSLGVAVPSDLADVLSPADERLRVLAPVLAAYVRRFASSPTSEALVDLTCTQLAQKASAIGSDSVYADLCRSLSSDCETPWIRGWCFWRVERGVLELIVVLVQPCLRSWRVGIGEKWETRLDFLSRIEWPWR